MKMLSAWETLSINHSANNNKPFEKIVKNYMEVIMYYIKNEACNGRYELTYTEAETRENKLDYCEILLKRLECEFEILGYDVETNMHVYDCFGNRTFSIKISWLNADKTYSKVKC